MHRDAIEAEIRRLQADLEDFEEAIRFEYTFTAAHIGGRQVKRDEESIERLRREIAALRALLHRMEGCAQ